MSHLFVCFVALVIQGGAMAKFWPACTTTINVWERIGDKHLAHLVGEGACQPDIFTRYRLGCELRYGTCPISLCALQPLLFKVVLWPNFGHCTTTINVWERIGEKHLAQLVGDGACQPDIFTRYRLGCELRYGTCPISLCALSPLLFKVVLWPNFGHCTTTINVWKRIGDKHLAQLVGEGACQPDIFTQYRSVCALCYGTCPISLCTLQPLLFKVVLWPNFGHCTTTINVWERIGDKHLAHLVGEGACQPDIFTRYRLGCELGYGTCPISLCALQPLLFKVVLWPNFGHCTTTINVWERIGDKHLAHLVGEGACTCQPDIFTKYRLGCELSYGTCPISLCAL